HPAEQEMIREQVGRLGDTPFELRDLTCDLAGGPMVPKSVLNDLRRKAVEQLLESRKSSHAIIRPQVLDELRDVGATLVSPSAGSKEGDTSVAPTTAPALHVLARTLDHVDAILALPIDLKPATI